MTSHLHRGEFPDLDVMLAQLRAAGVEVDEKVEDHEFGPLRVGDRSRGQPVRALVAAQLTSAGCSSNR